MPWGIAITLTRFGRVRWEGPTPAARSSSSVSARTELTPSRRFLQSSPTLSAPGKRPAMPMIAMSTSFHVDSIYGRPLRDIPSSHRLSKPRHGGTLSSGLFGGLGLLVQDVEPTVAALDVERAHPDR